MCDMEARETTDSRIPQGMEPELAALFLEPFVPGRSARVLQILGRGQILTRYALWRLLKHEALMLQLPGMGRTRFDFVRERGAVLLEQPPAPPMGPRADVVPLTAAEIDALREVVTDARDARRPFAMVSTDILERVLVSVPTRQAA